MRRSFRLSASSSARSFPVPLAPVTAGAPTESVRAEPIGREAGALGEIECLAQEGDCSGDRRKLVAADTDAVEHLCPVDVAEGGRLRELPRAVEEADGRANVAERHPRPALCEKRAELERRDRDGGERNADLVDLGDDLIVGIGLDRCLRAGDDALHALPFTRGDAGLEDRRVDAEPAREPFDGLARRARLPALDLADVLLREALAGELRLRQPARNAQLADALAHRGAGGGGGVDGGELSVH